MSMMIDGVDFESLPAEKFWSFPSGYKKNKEQEIHDMIWGNKYLGSRKMDGAYYRFIKDMDGNMRLQGRSESVSGGYLDKIEWVPQLNSFFDAVPRGSVLLGEIYFPEKEGSRYVTTIMGCLQSKAIERQAKGDKLHYYVFDVWAWNGKSYLNATAEVRFSRVGAISNSSEYNKNPYVDFAKYYYGPQLWAELAKVRELGGEGIVITKSDSRPEPGKRTARKTLKIKKELDNPIDCFLTGRWQPATKEYNGKYLEDWKYWEDNETGKKIFGEMYGRARASKLTPVSKAYYNGWAGAIEIGVMDGNKEVSAGWISGITEEVRKGIVEDNDAWRHKVVKVNAMEIANDTHAFRHGKIIEWRADGDKSWQECSIDQLK